MSTSSTSSCNELLPNSMFMSWPGSPATGLGGEAQADGKTPVGPRRDRLDARDDLGADARVADRRERQLDALLQRERLRPFGHGRRVGTNRVDSANATFVHRECGRGQSVQYTNTVAPIPAAGPAILGGIPASSPRRAGGARDAA